MGLVPPHLRFYLSMLLFLSFFFFFQAEDGIRDTSVTGVQTCALPICIQKTRFLLLARDALLSAAAVAKQALENQLRVGFVRKRLGGPRPGNRVHIREIGRASCRERV